MLIERAFYVNVSRVHFLNQGDDADLQSLLEDEQTQEEPPAVCTCEEKCAAGAVNMECELCAKDMAGCTGKEPEPEQPEETPASEKPEKASGLNPAVILLVLAVMGGIGVVIYLKFIKKKPQSATTHDPDDYDYDDGVEIPDEEEIEIEDEEAEEPDADGGGDEEREDQLK